MHSRVFYLSDIGMNDLKNFFRNAASKIRVFMLGRYGADELNKVMIISYFILAFVSGFMRNRAIIIVINISALVIFSLCIFRALSKNIEERRSENEMFLKATYRLRRECNYLKDRFKYRKTHVFKKCPHCKARLKLPKKRGVNKALCPKCSNTFEVKNR